MGQSVSTKYRCSSLHELKAGYQKNMLIANAIVLVLLALTILLAQFSGRDSLTGSTVPDPQLDLLSEQSDKATSSFVPSGSGWIYRRGGGVHLVGFGVKYNVIQDAGPRPSAAYRYEFTDDVLAPETDEQATIYWEQAGDSPGDGYSMANEDALARSEIPWYLSSRLRYPGGRNRSMNVRTRDYQPAEIRFTEGMRTPRNALTIPWIVIVTFDITESGQLRNFEVKKEDPPNLGLARALINQIQQCQVWAAKRSGEKVATEVTLTRTNGQQNMPTEISSSGGVVIIP